MVIFFLRSAVSGHLFLLMCEVLLRQVTGVLLRQVAGAAASGHLLLLAVSGQWSSFFLLCEVLLRQVAGAAVGDQW